MPAPAAGAASALMRPDAIRKSLSELPVTPHLADRDSVCAAFSWQQVRDELAGPAGTRDEHRPARRGPPRGRSARQAHGAALPRRRRRARPTHLRRAEARRPTASPTCSRALGVGPGDRVFVLAGRMPELYVAVLGALKNGSVVSPLFSAFGPEPIATRMSIGAGAGAGHDRGAVPAQGRDDPRHAAVAAARASWSARAARASAVPRHARLSRR